MLREPDRERGMVDAAAFADKARAELRRELRSVMPEEAATRVIGAIENLIEATVLIRITQFRPPS